MNTPNTKPTAEFQFERGTWDAKLIASNPNTDPTTAPKLVRVTCLIRADTLQALVAADQAVAAIGGGSALPASTWANGALSHCLEKAVQREVRNKRRLAAHMRRPVSTRKAA